MFENEMEIISKAQKVLENNYAFCYSTMQLKSSFLKGLKSEDYKNLDYKLKAIRQDFSKILVIMNRIEMTYSEYQLGQYKNSYFSVMDNQATDELGCLIEYLFAKYRVILEYIQQILEICIPPKFNDREMDKYKKLKQHYEKFDFLLRFITENTDENNKLLNMNWFQQLRGDRNLIIHEGATCLVFGDKMKLVFRVLTTDAMDIERKGSYSSFYCNKVGLIDYKKYWGLYISKLIVFAEIIFEFLLKDSEIGQEQQLLLDNINNNKGELLDNEGNVLPTIQSVLEELLHSVSNELIKCYN